MSGIGLVSKYSDWLSENIRIDRSVYREALAEFLNREGGPGVLLLTGHGGSGKTVLTEEIERLGEGKSARKKARSPAVLRLDFDLNYKPSRDEGWDASTIGAKEQAEFDWATCLRRLSILTRSADQRSGRSNKSVTPVFDDFFDHCISTKNTRSLKISRQGGLAIASAFFGAVLAVLGFLPDIVSGAFDIQIQGRLQLAIGVAASILFTLPFVLSFFSALVDRARYRKLGMRPSDFEDPSRPGRVPKRPHISSEELTKVFLFDLERWRRPRKRNSPLIFVFDLHDFTDDARARIRLHEGLSALMALLGEKARRKFGEQVKIIVVSKFMPMLERSDVNKTQSVVQPDSLAVTDLEHSEAARFVDEALKQLLTQRGKKSPASKRVESLAIRLAAIRSKAEDEKQERAKSKSNALKGDIAQPQPQEIAQQIVNMLAFGTGPDPVTEAVEVRDRLAVFMSGAGEVPAELDETLCGQIQRELDERERIFLENAFGDRKTYLTACYLAAFEDGLAPAQWPVIGNDILSLDEILTAKDGNFQVRPAGFFVRSYDDLSQSKARIPRRKSHLKAGDRILLNYRIRKLLTVDEHCYQAEGIWSLLKGLFNSTSVALGLDGEQDGSIEEKLEIARLNLSCLQAAARRQDLYAVDPFEDFDRRVPALFEWISSSFQPGENDRADLQYQLFQDAAIACLEIISPPRPSNMGSGLRGSGVLRTAILEYLSQYLSALDDSQIPIRFRLLSKFGMIWFNRHAKSNILSEKEGVQLDFILGRLSDLHEVAQKRVTGLTRIQNNYSQRKLRSLAHQIDDFNNALQLDASVLDASQKTRYAEILLKMSSSLASIHLDPLAKKNPHPGKSLSVGELRDVFGQFVAPALDRARELESKTSAEDQSIYTNLHWSRLRALNYWISNLRKNAPADANVETLLQTPSDLFGQLQATIQVLEDSSFYPDASTLVEHLEESDRELSGLDEVWNYVRTAIYDLRRRGLERHLAEVQSLRARTKRPAADWQEAFSPLILLLAQTFLTPTELKHAETKQQLSLRVQGRRLYAEALVEHWLSRIRNAPPGQTAELDEKIRVFSETDYYRDAVAADNDQVSYTDPKFAQNLLAVLACLNPASASIKTGNIVVARVEEVLPTPQIEEAGEDTFSVRLSIPNAPNLRVEIPDRFLPSDLFLQVRIVQKMVDQSRPRKTRLYSDWTGKLLLLGVRSVDDGEAGRRVVRATARGPEYAANCLHLFCPLTTDWDALETAQRKGSNSRPLAWTGASNSWLTARMPQKQIGFLISNKGAVLKQLPLLSAVSRFSVFAGLDEHDALTSEGRDWEIGQFLKIAYRGLSFEHDSNGNIVFFDDKDRQSKWRGVRGVRGASGSTEGDDFDHRKNRTFLEMFRKVFNERGTIRGWTDPGRPDYASTVFAVKTMQSAAESQSRATYETDDIADYEPDESYDE